MPINHEQFFFCAAAAICGIVWIVKRRHRLTFLRLIAWSVFWVLFSAATFMLADWLSPN